MPRLRVALACVALALASCKGGGAEPPAEEKHPTKTPGVDVELRPEALAAAKLTVAEAKKGTPGGGLTAVGALELSPRKVAKVGALVEGRIAKIAVEPGDAVTAGGLLAAMDSPGAGRARADYLSALARMKAAERQSEGVEKLVKLGIDAERALLAARTDRDVAGFEVGAAAQKMRAVGIDASGSAITLVSPIAGTVIEAKARIGEAVAPSDTLFVVGDLSEVWLVVEVHERDVAKVNVGDPARVSLLGLPGRSFEGKVGHVPPVIDPLRKIARVRVVLPNPDGALRPGMTAAARIALRGEAKGEVVLVPRAAVQLIDGLAHVFVEKEPGKYELRALELGAAGDADHEVRRGLAAGERVVVEGAFILKSELLREQMGKND